VPAPPDERSATDALRERVRRLPTGPGVYLWKDEVGRVLYVGKAANLRSRASSYLRASDQRPLVHLLMRRATDLDTVSTSTPEDALLLENTLIKKDRPPYNLRLKDDKSYLLVRVDRRHEFPRLSLVRKVKKDGATYVGPFANAKAVRRTLRFLRTLYPLRTCSDRELAERARPCLYHQIGRCAAPCVGLIEPEPYNRLVDEAVALLRGRDDGLLDRLRAEMETASADLAYEHAAVIRDRIDALEGALERQETVLPDGKDRDVVAVASAGGVSMLGVVYVRDGHVVATHAWPQRTGLSRREVITAFLAQFYLRGRIVPREILVEEDPVDREGLEGVLARLADRKVGIRRPRRGPARALVEMAATHAAEALEEHSARAREAREALALLAERVGLDEPPERIEGYDVSHLGGTEPVGAMSVLLAGVPRPASYRHFRIREAAGGDDYAGMTEVIARRFAAGERLGEMPDLVLIDGGRGQVKAARQALEDRGVRVPIVGLAKARPEPGKTLERLVLPDRKAPLPLPPTDPALRLLVKARDEAHRFAGRYQRKRRSLAMTQGLLDGIHGVGPKRRRMLIERYGSVEALREASFEDLAALPGIGERRARQIRERLDEG
jgi:excinuclease ABC subunit C